MLKLKLELLEISWSIADLSWAELSDVWCPRVLCPGQQWAPSSEGSVLTYCHLKSCYYMSCVSSPRCPAATRVCSRVPRPGQFSELPPRRAEGGNWWATNQCGSESSLPGEALQPGWLGWVPSTHVLLADLDIPCSMRRLLSSEEINLRGKCLWCYVMNAI